MLPEHYWTKYSDNATSGIPCILGNMFTVPKCVCKLMSMNDFIRAIKISLLLYNVLIMTLVDNERPHDDLNVVIHHLF